MLLRAMHHVQYLIKWALKVGLHQLEMLPQLFILNEAFPRPCKSVLYAVLLFDAIPLEDKWVCRTVAPLTIPSMIFASNFPQLVKFFKRNCHGLFCPYDEIRLVRFENLHTSPLQIKHYNIIQTMPNIMYTPSFFVMQFVRGMVIMNKTIITSYLASNRVRFTKSEMKLSQTRQPK